MKKILIVNNDNDTMSLLKKWLEKKSYIVKYTSSGEDVPAIMQNFAPTLLLVDVLQKAVVEEMKSHNKTAKVPVILMTGYTLRQQAPEVAVEDVIEKPFNLYLLEKKIERLIS